MLNDHFQVAGRKWILLKSNWPILVFIVGSLPDAMNFPDFLHFYYHAKHVIMLKQ